MFACWLGGTGGGSRREKIRDQRKRSVDFSQQAADAVWQLAALWCACRCLQAGWCFSRSSLLRPAHSQPARSDSPSDLCVCVCAGLCCVWCSPSASTTAVHNNPQLLLLENVRFYKQETKNDPEFAKKVCSLCVV